MSRTFDADLLEAMSGRQREQKISILPEAAMARIRESAAPYSEMLGGVRFKIGDWVTPIKGVNSVEGAGEPHLVVDVRENAEPHFLDGANVGSHIDGRYLNVRVMCVNNGEVVCFWQESWNYARYAGSST